MKKLLLLLLFASTAFATVPAGETKRQYFECNGSATTFTFTAPCNSSDDIKVYTRVISTGVEELLTIDVGYTIAQTGDSYLRGGVVTISPAMASTYQVVISREIVQTQETSSGAITPISVEAALDKLTRQIRDLRYDVDYRLLVAPQSDPDSISLEIPNAVDRASKVAGYDSAGNANATSAVPTGSASFTTFGTNMVEAANALAGKAVINLDHVFDVTDYGADPTGATESTTGFQAAIDAATSGGIIFVPGGTFLCDSPVLVNQASLRFVGTTPTSSSLADSSSNASVILLGSTDDLFTVSVTGVSFENLYLDGNGYTGPLVRLGTGSGISKHSFRDVTFLDGLPALYAENAVHGSMSGCQFRNCGDSTTTPAMEFFNGDNAGTNCSDWVFTNCVCEDQTGDIIESDSSGAGIDNAGFKFFATKAEDTTGYVFLKGTITDVAFFGCYLRNNTTANVINVIGDQIKIFGGLLTGTTSLVTVTGDRCVMVGVELNCTNAGATANIAITGDNNRVIGCRQIGYGATVGFTGTRNTEIACDRAWGSGDSPPTTGAWVAGDIYFHDEITAGETPMWVCTLAGTPGTWSPVPSVAGATALTSNTVIVVAFNGRVYSNGGASGAVTATLPPAVVGLRYGFIRLATYAFRIDPNGTETIRGGGAGKYLELDADGNSVVLECFETGKWEITAEHLDDGGAHTFES